MTVFELRENDYMRNEITINLYRKKDDAQKEMRERKEAALKMDFDLEILHECDDLISIGFMDCDGYTLYRKWSITERPVH